MPVSMFSDVDGTDPDRMRASLGRRASSVLYEPYRRLMYREIERLPAGTVLDVGAGIGDALVRMGVARDAVGVEPSLAFCRAAAERGLKMVQGHGSDLPFGSGSVAGVLLERVLQHVPDVEDVLDECLRVVVSGGRMVVVDPVHSQVALEVEGFDRLPALLCAWRAQVGLASPDAAERVLRWAEARDLPASAEVFVCDSRSYHDARVVTNFPEWASLARADGWPVDDRQVETWEDHFSRAAEGLPAPFRLLWPVQVAVIG